MRSFLFILLSTLLSASLFAGCSSSNAEKLQAFCTDYNNAVQENTEDCEAMGQAIEEAVAKHSDVKLMGSTDDEASQEAISICMEAGKTITSTCAGEPAVQEALKGLDQR